MQRGCKAPCARRGRGVFETAESSYWYWDGTAEWAAQQRFKTAIGPYMLVGVFALGEQLPLFHMGDYLSSDEISGLHQYGTSAFITWLTDTARSDTIVARTWEQAGAPDALANLLSHVTSSSDEVADLWADFAARATLWDMPAGPYIVPNVAAYQSVYPQRPRIDAVIGGEGTGGWTTLPADRALHGFSYATLELARPASGRLAIEVEPQTTQVTFRATLVRQTAAGITYTPVALGGATMIELPASEPRAYLAIAAVTEYRIGPAPNDGDGESGDEGGCSTAGGGSLSVALALLLLLGRRRSAASGCVGISTRSRSASA